MMAPEKAKLTATLTDTYIDALIDYLGGPATLPDGSEIKVPDFYLVRDSKVPGLQIRIGKRAVQWQFYRPRRDHGDRTYHYTALGYFDRGFSFPDWVERKDSHVSTEAAREKAMVIGGRLADGAAPAAKRAGLKFGDAFEASSDTWSARLRSVASRRVGHNGFARWANATCCPSGTIGRWPK